MITAFRKHLPLPVKALLASLLVAALAGCGAANKPVTVASTPPGATPRAGTSAPSQPFSDPFERDPGHWVFESEQTGAGSVIGHAWGGRVEDPKASGGAAWATPKTRTTRWDALVYGPYYRGLPPGKYRADFYLQISGAEDPQGAVQLEVFMGRDAIGKDVSRYLAAKRAGLNTAGEYRPFAVPFTLPAELAGGGIEFRVSVPDLGAQVRVDRVEVANE